MTTRTETAVYWYHQEKLVLNQMTRLVRDAHHLTITAAREEVRIAERTLSPIRIGAETYRPVRVTQEVTDLPEVSI